MTASRSDGEIWSGTATDIRIFAPDSGLVRPVFLVVCRLTRLEDSAIASPNDRTPHTPADPSDKASPEGLNVSTGQGSGVPGEPGLSGEPREPLAERPTTRMIPRSELKKAAEASVGAAGGSEALLPDDAEIPAYEPGEVESNRALPISQRITVPEGLQPVPRLVVGEFKTGADPVADRPTQPIRPIRAAVRASQSENPNSKTALSGAPAALHVATSSEQAAEEDFFEPEADTGASASAPARDTDADLATTASSESPSPSQVSSTGQPPENPTAAVAEAPRPTVIGIGFTMAWGALALGMVAVSAGMRDAIIDDAYITFRYAHNLASGLGLVFNAGERVEGYTSLLWTLLASSVETLGADVPKLAQFFSVMFNLWLLFVSYAFARRKLGHLPYVALITPMLLLCNMNVGAWAAHGMETSLFTIVLTLGLMMSAPDEDGSLLRRDTALGAGLVLATASLTRPEGVLYTLLVLALNGMRAARAKRGGGALILLAITALVPVALHFIWRYSFYGEWLPNTFYAKATGGAGKWETGLRYLVHFYDKSLLQGLILVPMVTMIRRAPQGPRPLFGLATLMTAVYALGVGGDAFMGSRFFVPVLPIFYLLVQDGLNTFFRSWRPVRVATAVYVLWVGLQTVISTGEVAVQQANIAESMTRNRIFLGKMLYSLTPPGYTIALNTVGALPYYAERLTLDMYGLTDAVIARAPAEKGYNSDPGHEKGDGNYVLQRRPDMILLRNVWLADVPIEAHRGLYGASERQLWANPAFLEQYQPVDLRLRNDLLFGFYLRKDHPVEELTARFNELSLNSFGTVEELSSERGMERVLFEAGLRLMQAGRAEGAVREYERALELYPDAGEVHLALAQALEGLERLPEAYEHYQRATELMTESAMAWLGLGNVEARRDHSAEAVRAYQKALVVDPNLVDAYANLASQYLKEGHNSDAVPVLRQALNRAPRDLELWVKLGAAAGLAQRWGDAKEALERSHNISPTDPRTVKLKEFLLKRLPPDFQPVLHAQPATATTPAAESKTDDSKADDSTADESKASPSPTPPSKSGG